MVMAQAIKALEEERDFLRQTVLKLSKESLSSCSSSESSDSNIPRKRKRGHKKKTKSATRSNTKHSSRVLLFFLQQQPQKMYRSGTIKFFTPSRKKGVSVRHAPKSGLTEIHWH
ncbi:hypothetical protein PO909_002645 [Leuciscus waleckii]